MAWRAPGGPAGGAGAGRPQFETEIRIPPLDSLDGLNAAPGDAFAVAVAPLFEGAHRFLARLGAARPFASFDDLFAAARSIAASMPRAEQVELVDAHPRLGAPPTSVSSLSFREQGYDRDAAEAAVVEAERTAEAERAALAAELDLLNEAYERRFGFRYCVFVAGRSRAELLPGFRAALEADPVLELERALVDVVSIAEDRHRTLTGGSP